MTDAFIPTRAAGLARLAAFVPRAGRDYAALRNHDLPGHPHVSALSPWIRHRLLTEDEVAQAARAAQGAQAAKFLDEVHWRTYWKGWLEMRPGVWSAYRAGVQAGLNRLAVEGGLRRDWEAACTGRTGIEGFDDWARDLVATGYLHNHARMWFASIWVFTLRLPWELGADFFLRHLLDGDPASNTLSWRWVAGLHTPGKTYLATADNIAQFTGGRFRPQGLARAAHPVEGAPAPAPRSAPLPPDWAPDLPSVLILHDDDLSPDGLLSAGLRPRATAVLTAPEGRSPLMTAPAVAGWAVDAARDTCARLEGQLGDAGPLAQGAGAVATLADWAAAQGAAQVVVPHAPVGPVAEALDTLAPALAARGVALVRPLRTWDARLWPHATRGFFQFRAGAGLG